MGLHHPSQGIQKHARVVWCPKVDVYCVESIHVFALIMWIRDWEVPLGHVLLWRRSWAASLAAKGIDSQGEQAWVLVALLNLDSVELWGCLN